MEKRIKINKDRLIILSVDNSIISICEYFAKDNSLLKTYNLSCYDDFGFNAFTCDDCDKVSFDFDINHPLYFPLLHFLEKDDKVIIDDDHTRNLNENFLKVYKNDDKISMSFVNSDNKNFDKFNVFVNSIVPDCSSKIDYQGLDTKERLNVFFEEAINALLDQNHQITMEEYMTKKKVLKR